MACGITITTVTGSAASDDTLTSLHVEGTARGCAVVRVAVSCSPGPTYVQVEPDGELDVAWQVDIVLPELNSCRCDRPLKVSASCEQIVDDDGTVCSTEWDGVVPCGGNGDGCPTLAEIEWSVGSCRSDGTRLVTLTAICINGTPDNFHWEFGDGTEGNSSEATVTHPYNAPGTGETTYSISVTIGNDGFECVDNLPREITIPGCDGTCPTLGAITATPAACVRAGKRWVGLDVAVNGGGAQGFDWDFGDGETKHINGGDAVTAHEYDTEAGYTATVTMLAPAGCEDQEQTATFQVAKCPPRNGGGGGEFTCCALIFAWLVSFVSGWILAYFSLWNAAIFAWIAAAASLALWIGLCCRDCLRSYKKCCTIIRWHILAHQITLAVFSIFDFTSAAVPDIICSNFPGICTLILNMGGTLTANPWVWGLVYAGLVVWLSLGEAARCRPVPVIFSRRTWPSCKCGRI